MDQECKTVPSNRLQFFPIMMFAVVMGLSGLTIVYRQASELFGFSTAIYGTLVAVDTALFISIALFYLLKIVKYFHEVKEEFAHPVRINFFAASAISFLLISIIYQPLSSAVALTALTIGTVMQTFFTFYTLRFWINKNLEIKHSNPAWFIPIVGNLLVPVAGAAYFPIDFLIYYFAIGIFFWVVLTAIVINRIIFHNQLAVKFMPTLFIFIAPPAIGFIAYMQLFESYDAFAKIVFNLGIFFTLLLFFMYKNFLNLKFFISWWAFTFPLAAISLATMKVYAITGYLVYEYLSYLLIAITTVVVLIVAIKTLQHVLKKQICIQE